ncbi:MAG: bifunctional 4-hydroxy-2-oxoglutarate aldolase/2-dehydro-3-deoxy-phosphogluconate aldolase, partial [Oscillospiraceae bacterium]
MNDTLRSTVLEKKIIVALRNVSLPNIGETVKALYAGGIRLIEITFNQAAENGVEGTKKAIFEANSLGLQGLWVGAGTVMSTGQVLAAKEAGAHYVLSPNLDSAVVQKTKELGMLSIPGAFSPSEIAAAYNLGAAFVKVFPVDLLGIPYIKALTAPLNHIPLIAMGGINDQNMLSYLNAGMQGVGVGSN